MEIPKEIKEKVFAQYLGQRWRFQGDKRDHVKLYLTDINDILNNPEFNDRDIELVLKPISSITDEDALECMRILKQYGHPWVRYNIQGIVKCVKEWLVFKWDIAFKYNPSPRILNMFVYEYLKSKGYDLPHYLLDGKTLREAGLASYIFISATDGPIQL